VAAYVILLAFMAGGQTFLRWLHLSETSLEIAGGVILFMIALRMVFPRPEGIFGDPPGSEPFLVPLAIPSIAGPSALATVMLMVSRDPANLGAWFAALSAPCWSQPSCWSARTACRRCSAARDRRARAPDGPRAHGAGRGDAALGARTFFALAGAVAVGMVRRGRGNAEQAREMTRTTTKHAARTGNVVEEIVPVHVWDWPVRLFHWSIVALVAAAIITAYLGGDAKEWHMRAGYGVLAMVLFRVAWGFAGTRHARFASFLHGPRTAIRYARSFVTRAPPVSIGHNPLGGWSVIALLAALLVQAGTGLFANDDLLMEGPLVKFISDALSDRITTFHHLNVWAIGILVGVHIAAVVSHWVVAKENLVRPMLTGRKRLHRSLEPEGLDKVPHVRALALLAASAFTVWWIVARL
jgi:cytochrome b